jgi:hypothetical protein
VYFPQKTDWIGCVLPRSFGRKALLVQALSFYRRKERPSLRLEKRQLISEGFSEPFTQEPLSERAKNPYPESKVISSPPVFETLINNKDAHAKILVSPE